MSIKIENYCEDFYELTAGLAKVAFIRKKKNKWEVVSRKGKSLGTYDTKAEAEKRLRQIEYFKHKKASLDNPALTYSSLVRFLGQQFDSSTVEKFQKIFKDNFDRLYLEGNEEPEHEALELSLSAMKNFKKKATAIEMGDPIFAGKRLSELVKFLLRRVPEDKRFKALQAAKKKIFMLNEYEMGAKKMPIFSPVANSITVLKNILLEHEPEYIRKVLNAVVGNL